MIAARWSWGACLLGTLCCLGAFVSAHGSAVACRPAPNGAPSTSLHFGLDSSPWLTWEQNAYYVDGTSGDGVHVHLASWSWLLLAIGVGGTVQLVAAWRRARIASPQA